MTQRPIYTIGHGGRTVEDFVDLLGQHQIAYVIDVRSRPYSRYQPDFTKQALEGRLKARGIGYVFMGDSLGGRPDDPECYTGGKVDYDKVRNQAFYRAGLERLEKARDQGLGVVLLCSERKPESCHRSKLIGRSLSGRGVEVAHIDEDDEVISQEAVMLRVTGGQPSLFGPDFHKLTSRKRYQAGDDDPGEEPGDDT